MPSYDVVIARVVGNVNLWYCVGWFWSTRSCLVRFLLLCVVIAYFSAFSHVIVGSRAGALSHFLLTLFFLLMVCVGCAVHLQTAAFYDYCCPDVLSEICMERKSVSALSADVHFIPFTVCCYCCTISVHTFQYC